MLAWYEYDTKFMLIFEEAKIKALIMGVHLNVGQTSHERANI